MKLTKISVVVTAYNHEKYIRQCLDGILLQKGALVLEVILGDDCSPDGTRQVMEEYQARHPQVFVLLPPTGNLGIQKNIKRCLSACSGDYIAFCEGDDYWTDKYKLQKQMEFLETHPDCSLCFHPPVIYLESLRRYELSATFLNLNNDTLSIEDLIAANWIGTFSVCLYRADVAKNIPEGVFDLPIADWMYNMACARLAKIGYIRDLMAVYRIHEKGSWSGKRPAEQLRVQIALIDPYNKFFSYEYDRQFSELRKRLYRAYVYLVIRQAYLKAGSAMIAAIAAVTMTVVRVKNRFRKTNNMRNT